jgi:hypothetical protein
MSNISKSAFGENLGAKFEAAIAACQTPVEVASLMEKHGKELGLYHDDLDPFYRVSTGVTAPTQFTKTVTIGDKSYRVEADSELALERAIGTLYRQSSDGTAEPATEQSRDEATGRFMQPRETVDDVTDSLVARSLREQGIDPEALREFSENRQTSKWQSATEQFKRNHPEYPGGVDNMNTIGQLLINSQLDTEPSVESLEKAYKFAVENDMLVANPETEALDTIAGANSVEEIRQALGRDAPGVFGR